MRRDVLLVDGKTEAFLSALRSEFPEAVEPSRQYLAQLEKDASEHPVKIVSHHHRDGRIESFHHYLGGLLYPLILHAGEFGFSPNTILHVQDCGNLNRHVEAVAGCLGLTVRFFPVEIRTAVIRANAGLVLSLPPFDRSKESDKWLHPHETEVLRAFGQKLTDAPGEPRIPVLLISRGASDSVFATSRFKRFYSFHGPWNQTGASRRHVPNEDELVERLNAVAETQVACLEDMELAEQIALFRRADIVIGQHGAGLNGILWCDPGTSVLELLPIALLGSPDTYFRNMAGKLGLRHTFLLQEGAHREVDVDAITRYVAQRVTERGHGGQ